MAIGDVLRNGARGPEVAPEVILKGLNPEQVAVVVHALGPLLAVAVAGAGKTAAVVRRMAYLVKVSDVPASRILAVTFSRKGADEMNERLKAIIGESDARVGTFHSLALEICKKEIPELSEWTIDDRNKYRICIKDAVGYKQLNWKEADATVLESFVGTCKANLARPFSDAAIAIAEANYRKAPGKKTVPQRVMQAYEVAERLRKERRLLTFDDMLVDAVELLSADESARIRWSTRWDYVIQDEAQDQNLAQLKIGELLAKDHKNYMLVGDPAQTIYTWRGAQPDKLLSFEADWTASVVQMGRNYRCGSVIIDAANKVLDCMDPAQRLPVSMIAERRDNGVPVVGEIIAKTFVDLDAEGQEIAARCQAHADDGKKWSDMAVLYRTNAQSRAVEEAMLSARIPYRILGGTNFYERREVRALVSYCRLGEGRGTIDDIERCINCPFRYLGRAIIERITDEARKHNETHGKTAKIDWIQIVRNVSLQEGLQSRQKESLYEWADLIREISRRVSSHGGTDSERGIAEGDGGDRVSKPEFILEQLVMSTRYIQWLEKDEGEESTENSRVSNVRELIRASGRFATITELLDYIDKVGQKVKREKKSEKTEPNKVTLCTLHRSKGMEWPSVYLCGVSEGILPHARAEDIEEERRLFYVGVTRARDVLHISSVINISLGSRVIVTEPSQFIAEAGLSSVRVEKAALGAAHFGEGGTWDPLHRSSEEERPVNISPRRRDPEEDEDEG